MKLPYWKIYVFFSRTGEVFLMFYKVYKKIVKNVDDIGNDDLTTYNELFALVFVTPYIASNTNYR